MIYANDAMGIMGEHASDFPDRMRMILAGVQIKIECLFGTTDVCFFVFGPCPYPL